MGRKKIQISRITDERNRQVTFNKRKFGVMKKAYELSVLCDCEIALIIFSSSNKLYQYASTDMDKVLLKYTEYNEPHESLTNKNIIEALNKKEHKNGVMSPDSPEPDTEYQLTPRTEAKYSKIDEEFQMMLQRNQLNGQRGMSAGSYAQPVSVPVNINYGDSGLLQSSPQMANSSISPRPSSSETDSVYPSGSMLEMSNGYPNSASPMHGSPSPGPSPGPGLTSVKHPKQHSPGIRTNLRVVIPTPIGPGAGGGISSDEASYAEQHSRNHATLNTPVVSLQTPGLANYHGTLSSFGPQDFSIGPDMGLSAISWSGHPITTSLAHTGTCLPHLAVSSSTPPPCTSPLPVKIKSEPISPPREHHTAHSTMSNNGCGGGGGGSTTTTSSLSSCVSLGGTNNNNNNNHSNSNNNNNNTGGGGGGGGGGIGGGGGGNSTSNPNLSGAIISGGLHHGHITTLNLTHSHHPRPNSAGQLTSAPSPSTTSGGGGGGGTTAPNTVTSTAPPPSTTPDFDNVQMHKRARLTDWPS